MSSRKAIPPDHQRCEYTTSHGKRCTSPQDVLHRPLCEHHHRIMLAKLEESRIESEQLDFGETILSPDQPFDSAQAVNTALTRIFRGLCEGRITPRHAAALGYVAQLIISTLPGMAREAEARSKHPVLGANPDAVFAELASALRESLPAALRSAEGPGDLHLTAIPSPDVALSPNPDNRPGAQVALSQHPDNGFATSPESGPSPKAPASGLALSPELGNNGVRKRTTADTALGFIATEEPPDPGPENSEAPQAAREHDLCGEPKIGGT